MRAIQEVLLSDALERVVYVCPTKSLVNQLFIEVKNRFNFDADDEDYGDEEEEGMCLLILSSTFLTK